MMTTNYEYLVETQDQTTHEEVRFTQPTITRGDVPDNYHLKLARQQIEEYERRVNYQQYAVWDAQRDWENRAYHLSMMHAAYAQAEAATRQAEAIEDLLEFAAELVGSTDLVNALLQWGYKQRAG